MQTSYEVIDGLLRGTGAERVGLNEYPWGDTLKKWAAQGMPTDDDGNPVDVAEHFGFDFCGYGGGFSWEPIPGVAEVVEKTDEWRIVRNGGGALLKWWNNKSGTPEHVDFTMTRREIWDRDYRPHVVNDPASRVSDETLERVKTSIEAGRAAGKFICGGGRFIWESMRGTMGDLTLYTAMIDDPDWIHDFCRCYTDMYIACYEKLFAAGKPDGMRICEDMGYRDRTFASPQMFGELIFPYFKELVDFLHSQDVLVILHTCGLTEPLIPMVIDAGFDGMDPMEVKAGNDISRIADQHGQKLMLKGGLDARILESGDRDLIRRSVAEIIEGMKARGVRYVFGSDHSLSTNVDYADYCYAVEVYREHMMY